MALITIHRKRKTPVIPIPYWIMINDIPVALMKDKDVSIKISEGEFKIGIRLVFRISKWDFYLGGEKHVNTSQNNHIKLLVTDKERWWNLLFDIDIVFVIAKLFFDLPSPWNWIYEIISNGFFVAWLIRIWVIRKNYFQLKEILDS